MKYIDLPPIHPVGPTPAPAPRPVPWRSYAPWAAVAALALAFGGYVLWDRREVPAPGPGPTPAPVVDYDPAFVPVGKQYAHQVGLDWAGANADAARMYVAGQPRETAEDAVAAAFRAARMKSYEAIVNPAMERIVPRTKAEKDLTIEDKAKLARAHMGLKVGGESR